MSSYSDLQDIVEKHGRLLQALEGMVKSLLPVIHNSVARVNHIEIFNSGVKFTVNQSSQGGSEDYNFSFPCDIVAKEMVRLKS